MAEAKTAVANKPVWIDLATTDAGAARDFYSKVFGWKLEVDPDPQYGGYAMGKLGDKQVAGIGPKMSPEQPTVWTLYIGTDNADDLARRRVERGWAFGGVEHAEPPRCPRADIYEPAASAKRLHEQVDPLGDPLALTADDARYRRIFGIHQVHDLETRCDVDSLGVAIALLGAAGIVKTGFGHGRWRQIRC